jgi:hypothetical protein
MNETTLVVLGLTSVVLIGFVLFVLWLRLPLESRLVVLGIALAVFATWGGALSGAAASRASSRAEAAVGIPGDVVGGLLKLATLLTLGGIVAGLLARGPSPSPAAERPRDVPPSV